MSKKIKYILQKNEIECFYKILSQYETETNHKGYNYSRIDKTLQSIIKLEMKKTPIVKPYENNVVYYTGRLKAADFLKHVRNSFAHCNIVCDDKSNIFSFYDEHRGLCTMSGCMSKSLFYKLIKELNNTRI